MKLLKIVAGLFLLVCAGLTAAGLLTHPRPADVAIVLGNTVYHDGTPSPRLAARLGEALQCYERRQCRIVFVSGGIEASGTNEAAAMRAWLVRRGVPDGSIVEDEAGNDTWATALHASEFMRKRGLSSAVVVTQYFHLPRTMLALKRFGVAEVSGVYPWFWETRDVYSIVREGPAFVWYAVRPV
ncbi:YdcF family protein [Trinickia violacea]|uniref:YdcF family protein n=1 Tax=Trinickia violacea TaxID=2571746 RepID=A0A4P8ISJ0_9BURK|nr:YdcF family protein [Trinickia violacea]QCP51346.1 YdcF family protein [Trinickia violacea]